MRREHARALLLVLAVTTAGIAASVVGEATTPGASGAGTAAPSVGDAAVTTTATPTATIPDENATVSDGLVALYETGDGEVVHSAGLTSNLGATIRNGDFVEDPRFIVTTENESQAEALRAAFGANGTATSTGDAGTGTTVETKTGTETESTDGSVPGLTGIAALVALCLALVGALANARRAGR